jgi:undecaprenyl-diphosphatase
MDFAYLILGLVQGLTEFLPVSSSGHLTLFGKFLFAPGKVSEDAQLAINVVLHMGTLMALFVFFRKQIFEYIKVLFEWIKKPTKQLTELQQELFYIILLTIPTGLIGLSMKKMGVSGLPVVYVLVGLLVTGTMCIIIDKLSPKGEDKLTLKKALFLGVMQGFAVLPGISRSGTTICSGLFINISREKMASFSFLMSIPAILAAFALEVKDMMEGGTQGVDFTSLLGGTFVAFVSGYLSLFLLIKLLKKKNFKVFGIYCICVSLYFLLIKGI